MDPAPREPLHRRLDLVWVVGFLLVLVAPTLDELVRDAARRGPEAEMRNAHRAPRLPTSLREYANAPRAIEAWHSDVFGLRDVWLAAHSLVRIFLLGSPPSSMFLVGDDGWIFYRDAGTVPDFRGLVRLDLVEREAWKRRFEARRDYLASRGIRYLVVLVPNKQTVYPERFPARYPRVGASVLDQMLRYVGPRSTVDIVDLRPAFARAKADDRPNDFLYTKTGTHWTPRGSFVALRELTTRLAALFPGVEPARVEDYGPEAGLAATDSLYRQMYLGQWLREPAPRLVPLAAQAEQVEGASSTSRAGRRAVYRTHRAEAPRVLVFHDSFLPFVERALAVHAARLTLQWSQTLDVELVEREHPDVVIDMFVERSLLAPTLLDFTPPARDTTFGFEASATTVGTVDLGALGALDPTFAPLLFESETGARLRLELAGTPRSLALPETLFADGEHLVLCAQIDAAADGTCELIYRCRGDHPGRPSGRARQALAAGRNTLYFDFDGADVEGAAELRLAGSGTVLVRSIETRRVLPR